MPGQPLWFDTSRRVCAGTPLVANATEAQQAALLANVSNFDVAPARVLRNTSGTPTLLSDPEWHANVAVVTVLHVSGKSVQRFGDARTTTSILCSLFVQMHSLRTVGRIPSSVPFIVIHNGLDAHEVNTLDRFGIVTRRGSVPSDRKYENAFEASTTLKLEILRLDYDRVLFLDVDMYCKGDVSAHLRLAFDEGLVAFSGPTTPVSAQLMVVRPSKALHAVARQLAEAHAFSVQRGWNNSGLLRWPERQNHDQCDAQYLRSGTHIAPEKRVPPRECELWGLWRQRCERYGITNWHFMHAGSDQGLFYWLFNVSGLSTSVFFQDRANFRLNNRHYSLGLPHFVHAQGPCKPWLYAPSKLSKPKCRNAYNHFFGSLWPRVHAEADEACLMLDHKSVRWAAATSNRSTVKQRDP